MAQFIFKKWTLKKSLYLNDTLFIENLPSNPEVFEEIWEEAYLKPRKKRPGSHFLCHKKLFGQIKMGARFYKCEAREISDLYNDKLTYHFR